MAPTARKSTGGKPPIMIPAQPDAEFFSGKKQKKQPDPPAVPEEPTAAANRDDEEYQPSPKKPKLSFKKKAKADKKKAKKGNEAPDAPKEYESVAKAKAVAAEIQTVNAVGKEKPDKMYSEEFYKHINSCTLGYGIVNMATDDDAGRGPRMLTRVYNTRPSKASGKQFLWENMGKGNNIRRFDVDTAPFIAIDPSAFTGTLAAKIADAQHINWTVAAKKDIATPTLLDGAHRKDVMAEKVCPVELGAIKEIDRQMAKNPDMSVAERSSLLTHRSEVLDHVKAKADWACKFFDAVKLNTGPYAHMAFLYLAGNKVNARVAETDTNVLGTLYRAIKPLSGEKAAELISTHSKLVINSSQTKMLQVLANPEVPYTLSLLNDFPYLASNNFCTSTNLYNLKGLAGFFIPLIQTMACTLHGLCAPDISIKAIKASSKTYWSTWMYGNIRKPGASLPYILDTSFFELLTTAYTTHLKPHLAHFGKYEWEGEAGVAAWNAALKGPYTEDLVAQVTVWAKERRQELADDNAAVTVLTRIPTMLKALLETQIIGFGSIFSCETAIPILELGLITDILEDLKKLESSMTAILSCFDPCLFAMDSKRGDSRVAGVSQQAESIIRHTHPALDDGSVESQTTALLRYLMVNRFGYVTQVALHLLNNPIAPAYAAFPVPNPYALPKNNQTAKGMANFQEAALLKVLYYMVGKDVQPHSNLERPPKWSLQPAAEEDFARSGLAQKEDLLSACYAATSYVWHDNTNLLVTSKRNPALRPFAKALLSSAHLVDATLLELLDHEVIYRGVHSLATRLNLKIAFQVPEPTKVESDTTEENASFFFDMAARIAAANKQLEAHYKHILQSDPFLSIPIHDSVGNVVRKLTPAGAKAWDAITTGIVEGLVNCDSKDSPNTPLLPFISKDTFAAGQARLTIPDVVVATADEVMTFYKYRTPQELADIAKDAGSALIMAEFEKARQAQEIQEEKRLNRLKGKGNKKKNTAKEEAALANTDDEEEPQDKGKGKAVEDDPMASASEEEEEEEEAEADDEEHHSEHPSEDPEEPKDSSDSIEDAVPSPPASASNAEAGPSGIKRGRTPSNAAELDDTLASPEHKKARRSSSPEAPPGNQMAASQLSQSFHSEAILSSDE
ncbi:hypothetical protein H0H93_012994 [Arthromyces matolae]|nr:hypothetical protein H0H93_012994 [Arthromyces matolae]